MEEKERKTGGCISEQGRNKKGMRKRYKSRSEREKKWKET